MSSTIDNNRIIQSKSEKIFKSLIPDSWLIKEQNPDFYIDYSIEIVENGELTGKICYVQLKGKSNLKISHKEIVYQLSSKHLIYFRDNLQIPVFLIVTDINQNEGYWVFLQKYINDNYYKEIPEQTKSIRIPEINALSKNILFSKAIIESQKYMTDLHSSSIVKAYSNLKSNIDRKYPGSSLMFVADNDKINFSINNFKGPLTFTVKNEKKEFYQEIFEQSKKTGKSFTIKTEDIIISGFDFLNDLIKETNITEIVLPTSLAYKSSVTLMTLNNNNQLSTLLNTIHGKTSFIKNNTESVGEFEGNLEDSPLSITLQFKAENDTGKANLQISLDIDFNKWKKKNICFLPHEEKLNKFFYDIMNNYEVELSLDILDNQLLKMKNKFEDFIHISNLFIKIHKIVFLCKKLNPQILFPTLKEIICLNDNDLEIMYNLILKSEYIQSGKVYNITCEFVHENEYPLIKGKLMPDIELTGNYDLEISGKYIILYNISIEAHGFEIENIISVIKENNLTVSKLFLKGNSNSEVIYRYLQNP